MVGWEDPKILFSPVAGYQNATLKNLALTNSGMNPIFTPEQIRDLAAHQSEESWFYDQIIRTALQQNYNLSVSGGSQNTTYMVSMGYYNQESNYVGNKGFGLQRYNMRSNVSTEIGRFKLTTILAYTRNNSVTTTGSSLEVDAARIPPYYYYKMKADDGRYLLNDVLSEFTPLANLEAGGTNKYRNNYLNASATAEFKVMEGLKLKGILGADIINDHRFTRQLMIPYYSSETATTPQRYGNENRETSDWNHATISHKDLNKIWGMAGIEAGATGTLKWTVVSSRGINSVIAKESRKLTLTRLLGFAELPTQLYITGDGSEAGTNVDNALSCSSPEQGVYEIFTKLEAGKKYHFIDNKNPAVARTFYIDNKEIKEGTAEGTVAETAIYRVILDFNIASVKFIQVQKLGLFFCPSNAVIMDLSYKGKGIWQGEGNIEFHQESWSGLT